MASKKYTLLEYLVALEKKINEISVNGNGGSGSSADLTELTTQLNNLKNQVNSLESNTDTLENDIITLENDIITLENDVNNFKTSITNTINTNNTNLLSELENKANKDDLARISSGTPLFASNISEMTDTTRNYVNTTDGYLYVYTNEAWTKTNVLYQASNLDGTSVSLSNLDDDIFVLDRADQYTITAGGCGMASFDITGINASSTISIKAKVKNVGDSEFNIHFRTSIHENGENNSYGSLTYSNSVTIPAGEEKEVSQSYTNTEFKKYLKVILNTGSGASKYQVKWNVSCEGVQYNRYAIMLNWNNSNDKAEKDIPIAMQERGPLATYASLLNNCNESLNNSKNYTDSSLSEYVYEIPDNNVGINKLSEDVFTIDKKAVYTVPNNSYAFASFDISNIENQKDKVINVEYYVKGLDDNFISLSHKSGTGTRVDQYNYANYNATISDLGNKVYKVTATYTILSEADTRFNIYPQITSNTQTQIEIYGANMIIDGTKLEFIEAKLFGTTQLTPILKVLQTGTRLAKLEYIEEKLKSVNIEDNQIIKDLQNEVEQLRGMLGNTETSVTSILNGKKWGVVGDSITYGTGTSDVDNKPYPALIRDKYLLTINKNASPGFTLASRPSDNATLLNNFKALNKDCDYITVLAGTNDYGNNIELGTINDSTLNSFYGALNLFCQEYFNNFYTAKFAFLTPTRRNGGENTNTVGLKLSDYINAIKDVCNKYGIPCLDMYNIGLNPEYNNIANNYIPDMLHPNDAGHERMSNYIAKFLEQL